MSRTRQIKPEFFRHEGLSQLSPRARLLYIGLWTMADKRGCLRARLTDLKLDLLPFDRVQIAPLLHALASHPERFIIPYEADPPDGEMYIYIPSLHKHQWFHKEEKELKGVPFPTKKQCDDSVVTTRLISSYLYPVTLHTTTKNIVAKLGNGILEEEAACTGFRSFWKVWPVHRNKSRAHQAWIRHGLDAKADKIIAAVLVQREWDQWKRGFIPHAATWLNGERWEDEVGQPQGINPPRNQTPRERSLSAIGDLLRKETQNAEDASADGRSDILSSTAESSSVAAGNLLPFRRGDS